MTITTVSSRTFNQDISRAKRAANEGPVFITDRGEPSFVLLSIAEYRKLVGAGKSLAEIVSDPRPDADFEIEFPRAEIQLRDADLT